MTDRDPVSTDVSPPRPRRRAPALIVGGLALAAAVVLAVVLLRNDGTDTVTVSTESSVAADTTSPSTEPSTTIAPSTTDLGPTGVSLTTDPGAGCFTVTTADGSATGCPQLDADGARLDQRTFVADLDGPVVITSGSSDPFVDLVATVDDGTFADTCRWDELAQRIPDGRVIEIVVCNDTGVMGVPTRRTAGDDEPLSYFTLPTPFLPDGTDLGSGTSVDGLPGARAFTAPVQDIATCALLLHPDRSTWSESCGSFDDGPGSALVRIDQMIHEITVDSTGSITSAQPLDAMSPSSGCSIGSANDLAEQVLASSIVMGIGCIGDTASLTTGSVLTQTGPPDGSIWSAVREDGTWTIVDAGTGIDDAYSFPVIPSATWSSWPGSTVPGFQADWWEPVVAIPTQPTVEGFADELLATLGAIPSDPEFPPNPRLVDVQPDGFPLIVAQVDVGGDDSVAGAVLYVWLDEQFDETGPTGWRAGEVLVGFVCLRGTTPDDDLCV